jgi:hypothetical protein
MKNILPTESWPTTKTTIKRLLSYLGLTGLCVFLVLGCQKSGLLQLGNDSPLKDNAVINNGSNSICGPTGDPVRWYVGLDAATVWELQQARAATSQYQNINNALADGYVDIGVNVQNMGHHFMNTKLVDGVFDFEHPEILVYNRNDKGVEDLVAVEYAIPKSYPVPEGFTGTADVWNGTTQFPFWLLHAWVWKYNPDGVFNWTNPNVHLH